MITYTVFYASRSSFFSFRLVKRITVNHVDMVLVMIKTVGGGCLGGWRPVWLLLVGVLLWLLPASRSLVLLLQYHPAQPGGARSTRHEEDEAAPARRAAAAGGAVARQQQGILIPLATTYSSYVYVATVLLEVGTRQEEEVLLLVYIPLMIYCTVATTMIRVFSLVLPSTSK